MENSSAINVQTDPAVKARVTQNRIVSDLILHKTYDGAPVNIDQFLSTAEANASSKDIVPCLAFQYQKALKFPGDILAQVEQYLAKLGVLVLKVVGDVSSKRRWVLLVPPFVHGMKSEVEHIMSETSGVQATLFKLADMVADNPETIKETFGLALQSFNEAHQFPMFRPSLGRDGENEIFRWGFWVWGFTGEDETTVKIDNSKIKFKDPKLIGENALYYVLNTLVGRAGRTTYLNPAYSVVSKTPGITWEPTSAKLQGLVRIWGKPFEALFCQQVPTSNVKLVAKSSAAPYQFPSKSSVSIEEEKKKQKCPNGVCDRNVFSGLLVPRHKRPAAVATQAPSGTIPGDIEDCSVYDRVQLNDIASQMSMHLDANESDTALCNRIKRVLKEEYTAGEMIKAKV
jgi:hypothetical protein